MATVESLKAGVSSVSPSSERLEELWVVCVFICSKWTHAIVGNMARRKPEKSEAMCQYFDKRGSPYFVVQAGHRRAQQIDWQRALQTAQKENTDRILFTITFYPHNHAVKSIIPKKF